MVAVETVVADVGPADVDLVVVVDGVARAGDPESAADGELERGTHVSHGRFGVMLCFFISCWAISELETEQDTLILSFKHLY